MPVFEDHALDLLPDKSRAKMIRLDQDRDAAHAALRAASDAEMEARASWQLRASTVQQQLESLGPVAAWNQADAERLTKERNDGLTAQLEPLKRKHEAALAARDRASEAWERFAFIDDCAQWLGRLGSGVTLEHYAVSPPKAPKGYVVEVERIRREIESLDAQWKAVESAPAPSDDLLARCIAEIDAVAERGALRIDPRSRGPAPLRLDETLRIGAVPVPGDGGLSFMPIGSGLGPTLVWLCRESLIERVTQEIEALPSKGAQSNAERERRFSDLAERRLSLERMEEAAIVAAAAQGQIIPRRRDCDARAILEVVEA